MKNSKRKLGMKWLLTGAFLFAGILIHNAPCQTRVRNEIRIPDIPGYKTLKCDFHIHTVYSDGNVQPHIRPEEAWREGFDAIAITDHVEDENMDGQHNRSYELARSRAKSLGIILIRGGEITRSMPPGHFNAIFIEDVTPLDTKNYKNAIKAAIKQGAFVFWNHPGWTGQQPDGI
ncbi:PHP domain-containing protein, partial [bacterium]